jgi:two-component system, OmpR family, sensor histidine kinase KdpD
LLTALLASLGGQLNPTADALAFLVAVMAVALAGGVVPAALETIAASLLLCFYFTPPAHAFRNAGARNAMALGLFVAVALVVSPLVDNAARRARQAAQGTAAAGLLASAAASMVAGQEASQPCWTKPAKRSARNR